MRPTATPPWAVILAGGDGIRLRPLVQRLTGDTRPKQFCKLLGSETLLERTRGRADLVIRPDRQVVVVARAHETYYADLARELLPGRLLAQPQNRGTAPAILLGALAVRGLDGDAPIVVMPSDHDVGDEPAFMAAVSDAVDAVQGARDRVVLLGIEPRSPEPEYGWIHPQPSTGSDVSGIRRFWEKPSAALARRLLERGCLWNSFVMVGWATAFEALVADAVPELSFALRAVAPLLGTPEEAAALDCVYASLPPLGFSESVLARLPGRLAVLRVKDVGWCDLGNPERVLESARRRRGDGPTWLPGTAVISA
jgi:mannose-1-phosphate guanylyltransferase